jgi:8-oxo-dGTP pyrophosphatase MutT (NUDIX family)
LKLPGLGRVLHAYWRLSRGLTLGVRVAVLDGHDRVFLVRHTYAHGWQMPGGGVEPGETVIDAARRELREEARIEMLGTPALHGVFFNQRISRRDHVLVYVTREFRVIAPKEPDREIAEARFFPLDALPADLTRGTRERLAEIVEGRTASERW